jgi:hypothetical protein
MDYEGHISLEDLTKRSSMKFKQGGRNMGQTFIVTKNMEGGKFRVMGGFSTAEEAQKQAMELSESSKSPHSVFQLVGTAEKSKNPVVWSK